MCRWSGKAKKASELNVLDLFSGIGGFSLGLERAGMRTVAFCECDPYARAVIARHWPGVPIFDDVRTLAAAAISNADRGSSVDVVAGGFPCQDISNAGKRAGIEGERSGLWAEFARIIGEVRPRYVIVENVAALLGRGIERVLGDLAEIGYDAEWHCIPASAVGAPHRRDRVWIVAYANGGRELQQEGTKRAERGRTGDSGCEVADADGARLERWLRESLRECAGEWPVGQSNSYAEDDAAFGAGTRRSIAAWQWRVEPDVGRVAHGVPSRVDRLRCLGNAIVPQIAEIIGKAILQAEAAR